MAIKANLVIDQGADFNATVDLVDAAGVPYDLTGFTVAGQIRKNYASVSAYSFDITHNDASGQLFLSISNTITADIEPGRYLYDIEITSPGGTITRVVEGVVKVTPGITRV